VTRVRQWLASPTRPRLFWGRRGFLVRLPGGTYVGRLTGPRDKGRSPRDSKSYLRAAAESCAQTELMFRFVCRAAAQTAERRRRWSTIVGRLSGVRRAQADCRGDGTAVRAAGVFARQAARATAAGNAGEAGTTPRSVPTPPARPGHAATVTTCVGCSRRPAGQIWTNVERRRYRRIMSMWFLIVALSPSGCS
jgi:hypothetical protein